MAARAQNAITTAPTLQSVGASERISAPPLLVEHLGRQLGIAAVQHRRSPWTFYTE
jgi:hypothetical protein